MNAKLKCALAVSAALVSSQAAAQITFYEGEGFRGRAYTTERQIGNLGRVGFNDRASSVVVDHGRWEVCEDVGFHGNCTVLRRGSYDSLRGLGLNNAISSVRRVDERRQYTNEAPAPLPAPNYDYRWRANERSFEAPVTAVRAVYGPPEQRCWVEHQAVDTRGEPNIGGAVAGAVIGGILGHQVGSGRGNDAATVGGALAGGAIGANVGREGGVGTRDVRRCETTSSGPPQYWDVTYNFRGVEHHAQMSAQPGRTILVNRDGEPRG